MISRYRYYIYTYTARLVMCLLYQYLLSPEIDRERFQCDRTDEPRGLVRVPEGRGTRGEDEGEAEERRRVKQHIREYEVSQSGLSQA